MGKYIESENIFLVEFLCVLYFGIVVYFKTSTSCFIHFNIQEMRPIIEESYLAVTLMKSASQNENQQPLI